MSRSVQDLYTRYRTELKPLVAEYESENEMFVSSWLDKLSHMFDRVALSETECKPAMQEEQLGIAYAHLDSAISDARRSVMASKMTIIEKFRKHYNTDNLSSVDNGRFIGPFLALEEEVRSVKDTDEVLAYGKLSQMVSLIQKNRSSILANTINSDSRRMTIMKWLVTILVSIITAYIISLLW
jgi:hypothetical protein